MLLKAIEQTDSGLNTKFVNVETGRTFSLDHVINQIEKGNSNYKNYQKVDNPNGTSYVRSIADGVKKNNIE